MKHLKGLTQLKHMSLAGGTIPDEGLKYLEDLTQLETLIFYKIGVTDAGLAHLEGLHNLRQLELGGWSKVTDTGKAKFRQALPQCQIHR